MKISLNCFYCYGHQKSINIANKGIILERLCRPGERNLVNEFFCHKPRLPHFFSKKKGIFRLCHNKKHADIFGISTLSANNFYNRILSCWNWRIFRRNHLSCIIFAKKEYVCFDNKFELRLDLRPISVTKLTKKVMSRNLWTGTSSTAIN